MSQDNKTISEEEKDYATSFEYVEILCSEKIDGCNDDGFANLKFSIFCCYTFFKSQKLITENQLAYYENRVKDALDITFLGRWWQYIKDWFHNKFNEVQIDLNWTEVIKRRQLSNLKDECNKFIMPKLGQAKEYLNKNNE